eukprot:gene875-biopygen721
MGGAGTIGAWRCSGADDQSRCCTRLPPLRSRPSCRPLAVDVKGGGWVELSISADAAEAAGAGTTLTPRATSAKVRRNAPVLVLAAVAAESHGAVAVTTASGCGVGVGVEEEPHTCPAFQALKASTPHERGAAAPLLSSLALGSGEDDAATAVEASSWAATGSALGSFRLLRRFPVACEAFIFLVMLLQQATAVAASSSASISRCSATVHSFSTVANADQQRRSLAPPLHGRTGPVGNGGAAAVAVDGPRSSWPEALLLLLWLRDVSVPPQVEGAVLPLSVLFVSGSTSVPPPGEEEEEAASAMAERPTPPGVAVRRWPSGGIALPDSVVWRWRVSISGSPLLLPFGGGVDKMVTVARVGGNGEGSLVLVRCGGALRMPAAWEEEEA